MGSIIFKIKTFSTPLLILFEIFLSINAFAFKSINILELNENQNCSNFLYYLGETKRKYSINQIVKDDLIWQTKNKDFINFGYTCSYWFKVYLNNPSIKTVEKLIKFDFPAIDTIELFAPKLTADFEMEQVGDCIPYISRRIDDPQPTFILSVIPGLNAYYFHIKTTGSINFKLFVMSEKGHNKSILKEYPIIWMFYGFLGALFIVNLFIHFLTREKAYSFFLLFILSISLYDFIYRGFAIQYLWPQSAVLSNKMNLFTLGFTLFFLTLFINSFLDLKNRLPDFYKISRVIFVFPTLIISLYALFKPNFRIAILVLMGILFLLVIIYESVLIYLAIYKKVKTARFGLLGFTAFFFLSASPVLINLGILPVKDTFRWMMEFGQAFTATMFAFAISDKINILKKDIQNSEIKLIANNKELLKSKEIAEEASKIKTQFLVNLNHEIRTPMNSILGHANLLLGHVDNAECNQHLEEIKISGNNLLTMIDDIIELAEIETTGLELKSEILNIPNLVYTLDKEFKPLAEKKGLDFNIDTTNDLPHYIIIDQIKIKEVLYNLISNAIKFTNIGFIKISIKSLNQKLNGKDKFGDLLFIIKDTGIGISDKFSKTIFEPFKQFEQNLDRKYEGLGIGLTKTKKIIEKMNGEISFNSIINKGTTFKVTFRNIQFLDN